MYWLQRPFLSCRFRTSCQFALPPLELRVESTGLPYPKLHIFIQSVIETRDSVALADAIDGMNLS
jgi:hypothetical protein